MRHLLDDLNAKAEAYNLAIGTPRQSETYAAMTVAWNKVHGVRR